MSNNVIVNGKVYGQGHPLTPTYSTAGVTDTSVLRLAADPDRVAVTLYNDSDTAIYYKWGAAAAVNAGLCIPVGGSASFSIDQFDSLHLALYAIHGAAGLTKNLLIEVRKFA